MVRSVEPVANHSLETSNDIALTQPRCPDITDDNSQGACQDGVIVEFCNFVVCAEIELDVCEKNIYM